jgi:Zn-finger nucleic acid-binding protein
MDCPRCKVELTTDPYRAGGDEHRRREPMRVIAHAAGVEIDGCNACGGIFLDHRELEKIQDAARAGKTTSSFDAAPRIQRVYERARENAEQAVTGEPEALRCPSCSGEMAEREWGFSTDVMVDTCIECRGVWLDFGELEALEDVFR